MSKRAELAAAIVTAINAATLPVAVTAVRRATNFSEEDLSRSGVQVAVFTGSLASQFVSRNALLRRYKPSIVVVGNLENVKEPVLVDKADALIDLVEAIETAAGVNLAGCSFQGFDEEQDKDAYNVETLRSAGYFAVATVLEFIGE